MRGWVSSGAAYKDPQKIRHPAAAARSAEGHIQPSCYTRHRSNFEVKQLLHLGVKGIQGPTTQGGYLVSETVEQTQNGLPRQPAKPDQSYLNTGNGMA